MPNRVSQARWKTVVSIVGGAGLAALVAGCAPTVGNQCDEDEARTPVYGVDGTPYYVGQAYMLAYCTACHTEGLTARYGAPFDLNFDPTLACTSMSCDAAADEAGMRHLLRAQGTIHRHRDLVYSQVVNGQMPPRNFQMPSQTFVFADDTEVPGIDTAEGRERLRNWLACGSPVVERTVAATPTTCDSNADCEITNFCNLDATPTPVCVGVGDVVAARMGPPITPTWGDIYERILAPNCGSAACHGMGGIAGNLDMRDEATAYMNLVGAAVTSAPGCASVTERVVPNDPDNSLFLRRLEGNDCGNRMPLGGALPDASVELVRMWIEAGAMQD